MTRRIYIDAWTSTHPIHKHEDLHRLNLTSHLFSVLSMIHFNNLLRLRINPWRTTSIVGRIFLFFYSEVGIIPFFYYIYGKIYNITFTPCGFSTNFSKVSCNGSFSFSILIFSLYVPFNVRSKILDTYRRQLISNSRPF